MKLEDILALIELIKSNWLLFILVACGWLLFTYLGALLTAAGEAHGERLASERESDTAEEPAPDEDTEEPLSSQPVQAPRRAIDATAIQSLRRHLVPLIIGIVVASTATIWFWAQADPCLKSPEQRTIQEQISCERE